MNMNLATDHAREHGERGRGSANRLRSWWWKVRHNLKHTRAMGVLVVTVCTILAVTVVVIRIRMLVSRAEDPAGREDKSFASLPLPTTAQQFPKIMHTESRCQKAPIFPFRVGCPSSCAGWRSEVRKDSQEIFYRTNIAWYFGQPAAYVPKTAAKTTASTTTTTTQTAYDKGINFQCPVALAEHFVDASTDLAHRVQTRIPDTNTNTNYNSKSRSSMKVKHQERMHLSLAYLCCIRANETDWVREIMHQWVMDTQPLDVTVTLDQVQCWHERPDSVSEIILVDAASQRKLTTLNHDLVKRLEAFGIPVAVPHEMQMPFHMTLQGFHRVNDNDDDKDNNNKDISAAPVPGNMSQQDLQILYEETERLSVRMGSSWTGTTAMRIQHAPRFGATARVQVDPQKQ